MSAAMTINDSNPEQGAAALAGNTSYYLLRIFQRLNAWGRRAMPPGRHPRDFALLSALEHHGPISQRALSELLLVNPTIMVKLVDDLEASDLVNRERDPSDRRAYALTIAPAGRAVLALLDGVATSGEADILAALTPAERERLRALLSRVLSWLVVKLPDTLTSRLGFLLANTHLRLDGLRTSMIAELGIEPAQGGYLLGIGASQPCSQQQLAERAGVTSPAISGVVNGLVRAGLVDRTRNPDDRRQYVLRLSPAGEQALGRVRAGLDRLHDEFFAALDPDERAELDWLLATAVG